MHMCTRPFSSEKISKVSKDDFSTLFVCSTVGRGLQLNAGAAGSEHKLLLFLHIDTVLPKHFDTMAWHTLLIPGVTAGAFQFGLDVVHMKEKRYSKYNVQDSVFLGHA